MARPKVYTEDTRVCVDSRGASHRLQRSSERRAIVNYVMDHGGSATIGEINARFGYDVSGKISALVKAGWLVVPGGFS